MSFRQHTTCRACQSEELQPVFDLGLQPLANDFQKQGEVRQGFYPLQILFCHKCTLSQLSVVVDKHVLYGHYLYTTSQSQTMLRHFERLFCDLASDGGNRRQMTLVEIGSNDGHCLLFAKSKGYRCCGIEPAANLATLANNNGVETFQGFFNAHSAGQARTLLGHPSVILARHCFAHVGDWSAFTASLSTMAGVDTLIAIEVPYAHDLLAKGEFDTVYHEHLSFLSVSALVYLLRETEFRLHRVLRYGIHGGSLLIMLRHRDSGITPHLSADEYLAEDAVTVQHWERFGVMARCKIEAMRQTILDYVSQGKIVCGFGASAKASVWLNAMGLTRKEVQFVSDNSPLKPGRLMPGSDIPIIAQDELLSRHPDVAIGFAWNFRQECLNATTLWRERGGKFVFPTPEGVEIV